MHKNTRIQETKAVEDLETWPIWAKMETCWTYLKFKRLTHNVLQFIGSWVSEIWSGARIRSIRSAYRYGQSAVDSSTGLLQPLSVLQHTRRPCHCQLLLSPQTHWAWSGNSKHFLIFITQSNLSPAFYYNNNKNSVSFLSQDHGMAFITRMFVVRNISRATPMI